MSGISRISYIVKFPSVYDPPFAYRRLRAQHERDHGGVLSLSCEEALEEFFVCAKTSSPVPVCQRD